MYEGLINNYERLIRNYKNILKDQEEKIQLAEMEIRVDNAIIAVHKVSEKLLQERIRGLLEVIDESQWGIGRGDCPLCFNNRHEGHAPTCRVGIELKLGEK